MQTDAMTNPRREMARRSTVGASDAGCASITGRKGSLT
jgi:hypothetical protein